MGGGCGDLTVNKDGTTTANVGIEGTPVIDGSTGTIYFVTPIKVSSTAMHYWLHAVDITNGNEKFSGPKQITYSGFNERYQQQRPALRLANGAVYVGFAGYCDQYPTGGAYHGYLFSYDSGTLAQVHVFNSTPSAASGPQAGIWHAGADPPSIRRGTSTSPQATATTTPGPVVSAILS